MDSVIIFCAKYLIVAVLLVAGLAWLRLSNKNKINFVVAAVCAGILAVILDKLAGKLYYDPRPFVTHAVKPLVAHAADNGFPSEHSLFSAALGGVTYFYSKKLGMAAFVLAVVIGVARVAAHIHSPIDIIGGIILGLIAGWCGYHLAQKFLRAKS